MPPDPRIVAATKTALEKTKARPRAPSRDGQRTETERCKTDIIYFIKTYCYLYDKAVADWIPFQLWPAQEELIITILDHKYVVILKSRQQGISWCAVVAIPLWLMIFHPIAKVLIFSQRDDEAADMIDRLRGMYKRLPAWMKPAITASNDHTFELDNESVANALTATAGGRSHAATYVAADEGDFIADTGSLVKAAKPTIDDGMGKMVVLSTVNDETPNSYFKNLFKGANKGGTEWKAIFLSWRANPRMTQTKYNALINDAKLLEGTVDSVWKEYPETIEQALAARSTNKRFPPFWISYFSEELLGLSFAGYAPVLPDLLIYREAQVGHSYGIGADPAEGKQSSDDSVLTVIDADTREEVAVLAGKYEPSTLADYAAQLSAYYNNAPILPERNNHGHVFIEHLRKFHPQTPLRNYIVDGKPGWHTSTQSKVRLYTHAVEILQKFINQTHPENEAGVRPQLDRELLPKIIHNPYTVEQLASIEAGDATGQTNKAPAAPDGFHDDYAMGWVLAQMCVMVASSSMLQVPYTGLYPHREQLNHPHMGRPALPTARQPVSSPESSDRIRRRNA